MNSIRQVWDVCTRFHLTSLVWTELSESSPKCTILRVTTQNGPSPLENFLETKLQKCFGSVAVPLDRAVRKEITYTSTNLVWNTYNQ